MKVNNLQKANKGKFLIEGKVKHLKSNIKIQNIRLLQVGNLKSLALHKGEEEDRQEKENPPHKRLHQNQIIDKKVRKKVLSQKVKIDQQAGTNKAIQKVKAVQKASMTITQEVRNKIIIV